MKILYITQYFSLKPTHAAAVTTYEIVKRLAGRGHRVCVISARSLGTIRIYENIDYCKVFKVLPIPEFGGKWYDGFASFLTTTVAHIPLIVEALYVNQFHQNFDAIISMFHPTHMATVSAYLLSQILKIPLIVKIHDFVIESMEPNTPKRVYNVVVGKINFRVLKKSSAILVQSRELIGNMKKLGGIDEKKMIVFPNGVDTNLFKPGIKSEPLREELRLEGDVVLLFLGGLYKARHPELLIKALPSIINEIKHVKLLFVGEGPLRPELLSLATSLGVRDYIKFIGGVEHSMVPRFISLADITIGPLSTTYDITAYGSAPLKVLEYMACAKPIIACRGQVSESIAVDCYNCVLFEPGDVQGLSSAVVNLISDQSFASYIGRNARKYVEKLCSWDVLIPRLENLLNSLIESVV
jgi:glycosyltransferase involved in cell wall biosynthesis